jgi:hypothetical protein
MKTRATNPAKALAVLLPLLSAGLMPLGAAPAPAKPAMPQSVFVVPTKPEEGRDPFFPNSTRPYDTNPAKPVTGPSVTDLVFRGIMSDGKHPLAIINDQPFEIGDVGDVLTKNGQRLTIHCLNINVKSNTVTVEANGSSTVLFLSGNP